MKLNDVECEFILGIRSAFNFDPSICQRHAEPVKSVFIITKLTFYSYQFLNNLL